jgi:3-oxoacyl-[acyl-carrier protein] reductase
MINLHGKVAIVTGGASGIGKSIALLFAQQGAQVAIADVDDLRAQEMVQDMEAANQGAMAIHLDVTDKSSADAMAESVIGRFGRIDILVNNAGITRDNLLLRMSEEEWDQVVDTNLKGVFLCTKAVLRQMISQRWGRIINMSSLVAITGNPGQANYAASKAGVIGFTLTMAKEIASRNITVNALTPGFIATQMVEKLSQDTQGAIKERIPLGRFGLPQDVAAVVAFLASDEASYITGQAIGVDGGLSL